MPGGALTHTSLRNFAGSYVGAGTDDVQASIQPDGGVSTAEHEPQRIWVHPSRRKQRQGQRPAESSPASLARDQQDRIWVNPSGKRVSRVAENGVETGSQILVQAGSGVLPPNWNAQEGEELRAKTPARHTSVGILPQSKKSLVEASRLESNSLLHGYLEDGSEGENSG